MRLPSRPRRDRGARLRPRYSIDARGGSALVRGQVRFRRRARPILGRFLQTGPNVIRYALFPKEIATVSLAKGTRDKGFRVCLGNATANLR